MATGKPRIISRSGKDVTGTSAASSERRGTGGSSGGDGSVSPAARKGYSSSKKKDDDKGRIKSTADIQKEQRERAGGGKDYSDIPEGTAVSWEKQGKAARESYEKGMKEYERTKDPVKRAVLESIEQGKRFRDPQTRRERPDRFDIESGETPRFAGQQTRTDVQREEQARREQQLRAQEAMTLPGTREPTLNVQRGPALTVARSTRAQPEQTARAYERRVESGLRPLTESKSPLLQFAGGAAETAAYAPTAIPRLAFGLARDPKAVAKETTQSQIETLGKQPARGLGQISAMALGPKVVRRIPDAVPYRIGRTSTEPGILIKAEMPTGKAAEASGGPKQYTIPTLESAPRGLPDAGRGRLTGRVARDQTTEPSIFTGKQTEPGISEVFVKATPEQLDKLGRRVVFEEPAGKVVTTDFGKYRVFEPRGPRDTTAGAMGKGLKIEGQALREQRRSLPFRLERRQELTPANIEFLQPRVQMGNVVTGKAREVQLIDRTGRRGFLSDESAQLRPTRTKTAETYPEFLKVPESAFRRRGGKVAVRERTRTPDMLGLQELLTQSRTRGRKQPIARPTRKTQPRRRSAPIPLVKPVAGTRAQRRGSILPSFSPVPVVGPSTAPGTTPMPSTAPVTSPPPTRTGPYGPRALPEEPPLPKEQRKKKTKRQLGDTPGFDQFKKKWINPTATGYDILGGTDEK